MRNPLLAVEKIASGLKCDAPGCGWRDDSIHLSRRAIKKCLNMPCPKCGANLLTEADARSLKVLMVSTWLVNAFFLPVMVLRLPWTLWCLMRKIPTRKHIRGEMNGSGEIKFQDKGDIV